MMILSHERVVTELDHVRLTSLLARMSAAGTLPTAVEDAAQELLDAVSTISADTIEPNVVTMRSQVRLLSDQGDELIVALAYPAECVTTEGKISVLSPLGLSLIGQPVGQMIQWQGPDGIAHETRLVEILYQPEAAGDKGT